MSVSSKERGEDEREVSKACGGGRGCEEDEPEGAVTEKRLRAKMAADLVRRASMKAGSPSRKILWKIMRVLRMTCDWWVLFVLRRGDGERE